MRFGVDVGGTFTDIVALAPDGAAVVGKVRSTPGGVSDEVWRTLARLGDGGVAGHTLVHGTTVVTNALLERTGGRVVLVTTAGFEDLLWLRRQDRAALYDLARDHPAPVVDRGDVVGVRERIGATEVVHPLEQAEVARVVDAVRARAPDAVAVSLLFSFRDPGHEAALAAALRAALPGIPVAASAEVLPVFREYERTGTTVAEAYLRPKVSGYLDHMGRAATLEGIAEFRVLASNGGTLSVAQARDRAASLALSGPAGGVEGARLVGQALGEGDLLTIDMGGTSADASVIVGGQPLEQSAGEVGGIPLTLPHILIETVGAGGGSIAWVDPGGALRVGPRSAGAVPGPACYGTGGEEATVTDAAVVLRWLGPEHPLAGGLVLDPVRAERAVQEVAHQAGLDVDRCAEGIIDVATATMVRALRRVSVERGVDPRTMTLVAFGGAGPMFVCRMAAALGMRRAVVPPHAGVLSALGLASAPAKLEFTRSLHVRAATLDRAALDVVFGPLQHEAREEFPDAALERRADARYPGQGYELTVAAGGDGVETAQAFHVLHRERFGHADPERPVELVNLRVVAMRRGTAVALGRSAALEPGAVLDGATTVSLEDCTVRIEPGWHGTVHETGAIVLHVGTPDDRGTRTP